MSQEKKLLWEFGIVAIFLSWWFFFVQTNVNPTLGSIYIGLTVGAGLIALVDYQFGRKEIPLVNPSNSWITAIMIAGIGYVIVIYGGQLVVQLLKGVPLTNALGLLQSTAPAFSSSRIINALTFGLMVAYIETYALFMVGFDLLASMNGVSINKSNFTNIKLWIIMGGISLLFLLLHATAKGITNQSTLIIVFFMALVSLVIVTITREGRTALLLHIIANSLAVFYGGL
jgi:hypothetical protein